MKVAPCRISRAAWVVMNKRVRRRRRITSPMVGEDNACLEDLDGLLGGQPSRSHRGPAQRWRMMSRQVPRPTPRRVRRGRIEEVNHAEEEETIIMSSNIFSKAPSTAYLCCNLFQLVLLLSSRSHQIFHSQFQKRPLCLPQTLIVRLNLCKNPQIMIVVIKMSNCI